MAAEPCPVLPDHLIEDILARLPAKSAHRCRSLSRAWAAALSSEGFADRHFRLANRRSCPKIIFLQLQGSPYHGPEMQVWSPEHPGGATLMDIPRDLAPDHFSRHHDPRLVTQPCRGLVILQATTGSEICYVCNPSTGQMAALPEGRPTGSRVHMESNYHRYASLGLGYDSCTRKHKVVRLYYRGWHAALYEESMVSPGQRHKDITFAMSLVMRRLLPPAHARKRLMCVCRSWRTMITMIESNRFNVA
nr:putative F-box/kelch-repeat protein At1g12870 [Aegilops tauschii subsp. strangulata]